MLRFAAGDRYPPGRMCAAHARPPQHPVTCGGAWASRRGRGYGPPGKDDEERSTSVGFRCTRAGAACADRSRHANAEGDTAAHGGAVHGRPARCDRRLRPPAPGRAPARPRRCLPRARPGLRRVGIPPRHDRTVLSVLAIPGNRRVCPRIGGPAWQCVVWCRWRRARRTRLGRRARRVLPGAHTNTCRHGAVQADRSGRGDDRPV
jgi:hypothetical protein